MPRTALLVGNASNADVAIYSVQANDRGASEPLQLLQTLYMRSSDASSPPLFGHLLAVPAAGLVVIAGASTKSVYAVHLTGTPAVHPSSCRSFLFRLFSNGLWRCARSISVAGYILAPMSLGKR